MNGIYRMKGMNSREKQRIPYGGYNTTKGIRNGTLIRAKRFLSTHPVKNQEVSEKSFRVNFTRFQSQNESSSTQKCVLMVSIPRRGDIKQRA